MATRKSGEHANKACIMGHAQLRGNQQQHAANLEAKMVGGHHAWPQQQYVHPTVDSKDG